jgi:hypothetical protein
VSWSRSLQLKFKPLIKKGFNRQCVHIWQHPPRQLGGCILTATSVQFGLTELELGKEASCFSQLLCSTTNTSILLAWNPRSVTGLCVCACMRVGDWGEFLAFVSWETTWTIPVNQETCAIGVDRGVGGSSETGTCPERACCSPGRVWKAPRTVLF